MKNKISYALIFSLIFVAVQSIAQQPEKIVSIVKVAHTNNYYIEQAALWKKEVTKKKKDADAWLNYYMANRYMQISSETGATGGVDRFKRLNGIVDDMEKNIPNSFEFNYVKYWNGSSDISLFKYLQKAYEIDSSRPETYLDLATYYELTGDITNRNRFLQKWYYSGNCSPGIMNYNYNVLMSLEPNAILITGGDNDTYYPWALQAVFGIRKDVMIINTSLTNIRDYANHINGALGISLPDAGATSWQAYCSAFIPALVKNNAHKKVYAGLTLDTGFTKTIDSKLYLVGLAYCYSEETIDNIALLQKNMEYHFALDYLNISFSPDPYENMVAYVNSNYIVPMVTLYDHYKLCEDSKNADRWKEMVRMVAGKCGMEDQVKEYIKD